MLRTAAIAVVLLSPAAGWFDATSIEAAESIDFVKKLSKGDEPLVELRITQVFRRPSEKERESFTAEWRHAKAVNDRLGAATPDLESMLNEIVMHEVGCELLTDGKRRDLARSERVWTPKGSDHLHRVGFFDAALVDDRIVIVESCSGHVRLAICDDVSSGDSAKLRFVTLRTRSQGGESLTKGTIEATGKDRVRIVLGDSYGPQFERILDPSTGAEIKQPPGTLIEPTPRPVDN